MTKKWLLLLLLLGAQAACASDYYVDCNNGSSGNPGISMQLAWRTLLQVGISSFQPGDTINLKRDCTWNETLTPPSSGTNPATGGALIKIASYGNGRAPHLTGYLPIADNFWQATGNSNVWAATLYSTTSGLGTVVQCGARGFYCLTQAPSQLLFVRFGTVWGVGQASQAALSQDRDWWYDATNCILYVYSASGKPAAHYGTVAPIVLSGQSLLNVNGQSWLEIQHLQIDWFDSYGVQVQSPAQGTSDHLWLANIAANSEVENGAVPLGFYVHPSGTPADIHLYNTDANMNYAGYRFDGCGSGGCAFEIKNCRAYANRAYGIIDNVQGAASYDYCHLYANNIATAVTVDTSGTPGPTSGTHNITSETAPWIREWRRWPAYTTVSYDDPGLVQDSDTYVSSLLPVIGAKGVPLSIAVVTGGSYSQLIVSEVQGWINAGWDVNAHSISHEYWDPPAASCGAGGPFPVPCHAFENLQYIGAIASSVKVTVSHSQSVCGSGKLACFLVTTVPDDPAADITWDLTPATPGQPLSGLDTLGGILYTLQQRGVFAVSLDSNAKSTARSISLADVANLDIGGSAQNLDLDETRMETEEMSWALGWMNLSLTGLPSSRVYVMPGSYADPVTEGIAAGLGYAGVRGTGSLKPCCGANTTLANGYDVFNILSQGMVPNYQGLSYQQLRNRVSQDLFKNALWGRPVGYFWHVNELRPDEVANLMDALVQGGASLKSNTQMVNFLQGCAANDAVPPGYVAGSYHVCPSNGVEVTYRSGRHAAARVVNLASIAAHQNGADNGVRGSVRDVAIPAPRTSVDCETAALALLDDAGQGWAGEYQAWSKSLPGGTEDIFPGDGLTVSVPSRSASFLAIVRDVDLTVLDLAGETVRYTLKFVDAGDPSLGFGFVTALVRAQVLTPIDVTQVGAIYLPDLTNAEVTTVTSTTVTISAGFTPPTGSGIEVRYSDAGWGAGNNRNLLGRFTTSAFTLPRYARAQNYFLRSYDNGSPAKYSRYSTALHVDYPL